MGSGVRGKSLKAITIDVAEGYVTVNPLFMKSFDSSAVRDFFKELSKTQIEVRAEKFPNNDTTAIRSRNIRLQRLQLALTIIRHFARERKIPLV